MCKAERSLCVSLASINRQIFSPSQLGRLQDLERLPALAKENYLNCSRGTIMGGRKALGQELIVTQQVGQVKEITMEEGVVRESRLGKFF